MSRSGQKGRSVQVQFGKIRFGNGRSGKSTGNCNHMTDEQLIRDVIKRWGEISATDNAEPLRELMAEDIVFLQPGQPPMRGRDVCLKIFQAGAARMRIACHSNIQEIEVAGELAYVWNQLEVAATVVESGVTNRRTGYTLSIFRKEQGRWVLFRDANLLTARTQ